MVFCMWPVGDGSQRYRIERILYKYLYDQNFWNLYQVWTFLLVLASCEPSLCWKTTNVVVKQIYASNFDNLTNIFGSQPVRILLDTQILWGCAQQCDKEKLWLNDELQNDVVDCVPWKECLHFKNQFYYKGEIRLSFRWCHSNYERESCNYQWLAFFGTGKKAKYKCLKLLS